MKRWLWVMFGALLLPAVVFSAELGRTQVTLDTAKVATEETAMGNFVADAVRTTAGAQIAILHAMAFRANAKIEAGVVDEQAMRNCLAAPTGKIAVITVPASLLRTTMQYALNKYPNPSTAFLQISGMKVTFTVPKGEDGRTGPAQVKEIIIDGKPVVFTDAAAQYTVAMPRELANGAVGYMQLFNDDVMKTRKMTDISLLDAIAQTFARNDGTIDPKVEKRLEEAK